MAQELRVYYGNNPPNVLLPLCRRRPARRVPQLAFATARAHKHVPQQHQQHQSSHQHSRHNAKERESRLWLKCIAHLRLAIICGSVTDTRQNGNAVRLYLLSATSSNIFVCQNCGNSPRLSSRADHQHVTDKHRQKAEHRRKRISAGQRQNVQCLHQQSALK